MIKTYKIADLKLNIDSASVTAHNAHKYEVDFDASAPELKYSPDAIQKYKAAYATVEIEDWDYFLQSVKFSSLLLENDGFVFHASAIALDGQAYLFSANSGVGKSTHTRLWKKVFPRVTYINDDKPAIRLKNGLFYVYGTPWSGKSILNENVCVPLKAICFIERAEKNSIRKLSPIEALPRLLEQTMRKAGKEKTSRLLDLLDVLLTTTPIYLLSCLPNEEAAQLAYDTINKTEG